MLPLLAAASLASVDVSFVPTESAAARAALEWASVGPGDTLYELGCGDGRVSSSSRRRRRSGRMRGLACGARLWQQLKP